jgi:hypothetical protein
LPAPMKPTSTTTIGFSFACQATKGMLPLPPARPAAPGQPAGEVR